MHRDWRDFGEAQAMTAPVYHRKLARVLERMGGLFTLNDILTAIAEGKMQSFAVNNSWAITQVNDYPRARTLQLIAYVGDLSDIDALQAQIFAYANDVNAGLVSAYGRLGWVRPGLQRGWRLKAKNFLYHRDL
jgi:hypothetical protein